MESNREAAFQNISKCKKLGFHIALDDAGSGYTSFADLRDYPIDIVKIDRSILDATVTQRGTALLRGVTALIMIWRWMFCAKMLKRRHRQICSAR